MCAPWWWCALRHVKKKKKPPASGEQNGYEKTVTAGSQMKIEQTSSHVMLASFLLTQTVYFLMHQTTSFWAEHIKASLCIEVGFSAFTITSKREIRRNVLPQGFHSFPLLCGPLNCPVRWVICWKYSRHLLCDYHSCKCECDWYLLIWQRSWSRVMCLGWGTIMTNLCTFLWNEWTECVLL